MRKPIQVMKFGGTSVGDAACMVRVAEIIQRAAQDFSVVAVVSAMSGVTNRLVEAAQQSKSGNEQAVAAIFRDLRKRHEDVVTALIESAAHRRHLKKQLCELFAEGESVCQATLRSGELTPQALDAISGLGERLCAPLVASVLLELGTASESIEATELIVTDSCYGGAEPLIDRTRARCQIRLAPLLLKGIVPVVTGFIGATEDGVPTTLGRGGSDYSATILGAALDASEVIIWSDVSGILTADPKLVSDARTLAEISYREAAELAYFGAQVLHPKTLRPVMQSGIPLWIKNSFAPEEVGTKITPAGLLNSVGVKSLTGLRDAVLIGVVGALTQGISDALPRAMDAAAALRADVLLVAQSSSSASNDICLVVPSSIAQSTVEALRREVVPDLKHQEGRDTVLDTAVSVITLVGHGIRQMSGNVGRVCAALQQDNINVVAIVQGSSDSSMSFVVQRRDMNTAVGSIHREFELGSSVACKSSTWIDHVEQLSAD